MIAVDQSEAMLAEMKKKFANVDKVDYRVGEAESLPIPDETVDYVFANISIFVAFGERGGGAKRNQTRKATAC